jgi:cytochrome P450
MTGTREPRACDPVVRPSRALVEEGSGFGGGVRLGHSVARTDMSVALPLLAQRTPDVAAVGPGEWLPVSGDTGPVRFPLRFTPEEAVAR